MAQDGSPPPTKLPATPALSGLTTPQPENNGTAADYLSARIPAKFSGEKPTYLAGCKALDSLARLITSTESFFHPVNGSETTDVGFSNFSLCVLMRSIQLTALVECILTTFKQRKQSVLKWQPFSIDLLLIWWNEEQKDDCKTPYVRDCCRHFGCFVSYDLCSVVVWRAWWSES